MAETTQIDMIESEESSLPWELFTPFPLAKAIAELSRRFDIGVWLIEAAATCM